MKFDVSLYLLVTAATLFTTGSAATTPIDHYIGDHIPILANSLRSLQTMVPFDYYRGPFCVPPAVHTQSPNLGSIILGEALKTSPYSVTMLRNESCKLVACSPQDLSKPRENIKEFTQLIEDGYRGLLSLDGLPMFNAVNSVLGGSCVGVVPEVQRFPHMRGYALGVHHNCVGETLVNNHIHFVAQYHTVPSADGKTTSYRVVGFKGATYSIDYSKSSMACDGALDVTRKDSIVPLTVDAMSHPDHRPMWTYSVSWVERVDVDWAGRWDEYVASLSITHPPMWILCSILFAMLSFAAWYVNNDARKGISRYTSNHVDAKGQHHDVDGVGWTQVFADVFRPPPHADVFRPPPHAKLLCIAAGNGVQLLGMIVGVLFLSSLGLFSPGSSGTLLTCIIGMYTLMAGLGGYTCGKLMKMFDKKQSHCVTFMCGAALPGAGLVCYTYLNIQNWHAGASDAVPFTTLLTLFSLLGTVILPSTFAGSMYAFKQPAIEPATRIGRVVREIPPRLGYLNAFLDYVMAPIIPLGWVMVIGVSIFWAMWRGRVYTSYGYITVLFVLWAYTTIILAIFVVYHRLAFGNHHWWWSSFLGPGCMGAHFFVFVLYFYFRYLGDVNTTLGTFKYFLVCGFLSIVYGLVSGTIGLLSSLIFTRGIYSRLCIGDAGNVEEGTHCQDDGGDSDSDTTGCVITDGVPMCGHLHSPPADTHSNQ